IEACLENKACKSFDTWGISDAASFYVTNTNPGIGPYHPNADPLMFDKDLRPKPAYFAVRDALLAGIRVPTPTPKP
ncbi:MAG: endo-1,4-beta-xylanase, partial [Anaerolineae bacterium]|nr:endo-1,4-beta-xylanase [Anaerolineae bacterium]